MLSPASPVLPLNVTVPLESSVIPVNIGVIGACAPMSSDVLAEPVLPAASISVATIACVPVERPVGVNVQEPLASAMAVAVDTVPSIVKCTMALASPVPETVPLLPAVSVTMGATVSSVKLSVVVAVTPAALLSLTTIVCAPSASPVGVNVQLPLLSALAVAAIAVPSTVKCTVASESVVPVSVALEVMPSVAKTPVSATSIAETCGESVLTM